MDSELALTGASQDQATHAHLEEMEDILLENSSPEAKEWIRQISRGVMGRSYTQLILAKLHIRKLSWGEFKQKAQASRVKKAARHN